MGNAPLAATIAGTTINRGGVRGSGVGFHPNLLNNEGKSPLHYAVMNGNSDLVSLLVQCGLDPHQKDSSGNCAVDYAAVHNQRELMLKSLLHSSSTSQQ